MMLIDQPEEHFGKPPFSLGVWVYLYMLPPISSFFFPPVFLFIIIELKNTQKLTYCKASLSNKLKIQCEIYIFSGFGPKKIISVFPNSELKLKWFGFLIL